MFLFRSICRFWQTNVNHLLRMLLADLLGSLILAPLSDGFLKETCELRVVALVSRGKLVAEFLLHLEFVLLILGLHGRHVGRRQLWIVRHGDCENRILRELGILLQHFDAAFISKASCCLFCRSINRSCHPKALSTCAACKSCCCRSSSASNRSCCRFCSACNCSCCSAVAFSIWSLCWWPLNSKARSRCCCSVLNSPRSRSVSRDSLMLWRSNAALSDARSAFYFPLGRGGMTSIAGCDFPSQAVNIRFLSSITQILAI